LVYIFHSDMQLMEFYHHCQLPSHYLATKQSFLATVSHRVVQSCKVQLKKHLNQIIKVLLHILHTSRQPCGEK